MTEYLITREGLELGSYTIAQIEKGLETGFFRLSDLGWCESAGWKGLSEIVGSAKAPAFLTGLNFNPIATTMPQARADADVRVPPAVLAELESTWPWVRFISAAMGLGCLSMIVACLVLMANDEALWSGQPAQHLSGDTRHLLMAVVCTLLTCLILYPALKLSNYAAHIARLGQTQSPDELAAALAEQRRFWRFCGILALMLLGACLALVVFAGKSLASQAH